jgi:type VI secretion system Hcp family effector
MKTLLSLSLLILAPLFLPAQNITITDDGSYSADGSAMLDVKSDNKGLLVPRMTNAQRNAIANPATGLLIFQTDGREGFYFNDGPPEDPKWVAITSTVSNLWFRNPANKVTYLSNPDDSVGIGTNDPQSHLAVKGRIESMEEGFMFPDGSVQSVAMPQPSDYSFAYIGLYIQDIPGGFQGSYCEDCVTVYDLKWNSSIPWNENNGQILGERKFKALTFIKDVDEASVPLMQRYSQGQPIIFHMQFRYFKIDPMGQEFEYYRITLDNVTLVGFNHKTASESTASRHLEEVSLIAEGIEWWYIPQNIVFNTAWFPPPSPLK